MDQNRVADRMDQNRVVARYQDGRVLKGTTQDFFPNRPLFHVKPLDGGPSLEVQVRQLKAVFFVKDYEGNSSRKDLRGFIDGPGENPHGKKIAVRFKDAELLCGYSLSYSPDRPGFFVFPADTGSNNLRVYVVTQATKEVRAGAAADAMAHRALGTKAA
jgi:hypothetical protein